MFHRLGKFSAAYPWIVCLGWIVIGIVVVLVRSPLGHHGPGRRHPFCAGPLHQRARLQADAEGLSQGSRGQPAHPRPGT